MKWLIGIALLVLITFVFKLGLLVYAAYTLFAVLFVSHWMTKRWTESTHGSRHCSKLVANQGDRVAVTIEITNRGRLPVGWTLIEDLLPGDATFFRPPKLDVQGARIMVNSLMPAKQQTLSYEMQCNRRGYYQIGPLVMETGDYFGLHRRFRILNEPHFLMVLPKTVPLEGCDVSSKRPIGEVKMTYRLYEDPTRIAGVREYERGDSLNRIHWKATARTGQLHSKIYEPSTVAGATILLNFHQHAYPPQHEPLRSELAITTAASLANAVFEMGQQIGFVTNGRDAADRIRSEGWKGKSRSDEETSNRAEARKSSEMLEKSDRLSPIVVETRRGPERYTMILERLARLELTDGLSFSQLILETQPRLPRDASIIAILPSVDYEDAISLGGLRRQGYSVTAILNLYDYDDFAKASGLLYAEGIETRHLRDQDSVGSICREHMLQHV